MPISLSLLYLAILLIAHFIEPVN